jgi:uncharacterized protein (TIGR03437 family)
LLVKRPRVEVIAVSQEGKEARFDNNGITHDRPPLLARLRIDGLPVAVIVVHMRSLIGAGTASVDAKRQAQANDLRALAAARIAQGEHVVVLGDFNANVFDPVMATITSAGVRNLTDTLPPSENYSYVLDGRMQTLDHVLISSRLSAGRYLVARVNADYPETYRNDAGRLERLSDHDFPLAYLTATPPLISAAGVANAATYRSGAIAPNEILTIYGRDFGPTPLLRFDGSAATVLYSSATQLNAIVPAGVAGKPSVEMQVESAGRVTHRVMVDVGSSSPGVFHAPGGQGAVLNQDYSLNGAATPAERGSIVMIYGTGLGSEINVRVRIGGIDAEVLYAGQAPGLVPGAAQINARVPASVELGPAVPIYFSAGERTSPPGVTMAVR